MRAALLETGFKRLKEKQLFPHEIARKCSLGKGRGGNLSSELDILQRAVVSHPRGHQRDHAEAARRIHGRSNRWARKG
jgi:hypothetical protein